ncbi:thiol-activated cytolysin family protein [Saccharothrix hoggarensis]|uniref:Thiol-activated cytolysin family protein n=1 Tax=Saccharothrix hoggarensis TaxID=913853 RepID=A0ABW3QUG1_9PSEU
MAIADQSATTLSSADSDGEVLTYQPGAPLQWAPVPDADRYLVQLPQDSRSPYGSPPPPPVVLNAEQCSIQVSADMSEPVLIRALRGDVVVSTTVAINADDANEPADMNNYLTEKVRDWSSLVSEYPTRRRQESIGPVVEESSGKWYVVERTEVDVRTTPDKLLMPNPSLAALWSGCLVEGAKAKLGELSVVPIAAADRTRITIDTDLSGTGDISAADIAASRNAVNQARVNLLKEKQSPAGDMYFNMVESESLEAALLEMGVSASYFGMKGEVSGSTEVKSKQTNIVACFIQRVYTTTCQIKPSPGDWFAPSFTKKKLATLIRQGAIGEENPPLLVSDVTFGRWLIFQFKTTENSKNAKAAIKASYEGLASVSAELKAEYEKTLREGQTTVYSSGGNASDVHRLIAQGKIAEYFKAEEAPSLDKYAITGFALRSLATRDVARMGESARYTIVSRELASAPAEWAEVYCMGGLQLLPPELSKFDSVTKSLDEMIKVAHTLGPLSFECGGKVHKGVLKPRDFGSTFSNRQRSKLGLSAGQLALELSVRIRDNDGNEVLKAPVTYSYVRPSPQHVFGLPASYHWVHMVEVTDEVLKKTGYKDPNWHFTGTFGVECKR